MRYNAGDKVVVNNNNTLQIGTVVRSRKRSNRRLYNILMESGVELKSISTNNESSMIFIDRKLTKSLNDKLKSYEKDRGHSGD